MEQSCLFCLETIKELSPRNEIGCECKILCHTQCLEKWFQEKQTIECPICHTSPAVSITVPTQTMVQTVQVTYLDMVRQSIQENRFRSHDKAVGFCVCICFSWGIAFAIVDIVLRK